MLAAVLLVACADKPPLAEVGPPPAALYDPCEPGTRAGAAGVRLMTPMGGGAGDVGFTDVGVTVRAGVDSFERSITLAVEGTCRLLEYPSCEPACAGQTTCVPGNRCATTPPLQDVGTVTIHGLAVPVELTSIVAGLGIYSRTISDPFPAVAPDVPVKFETSGGAFAPFSLEARGVEVLAFEGANLSVGRGRSLDLTWMPPARPGAARIQAILSLRPSVNEPAIECTFPDTGAASIPASLIDLLLDRGAGGLSRVDLARRTVASTTIAPGCVHFEVTAGIRRSVSVDGVTFCDFTTVTCPPPLTCQLNYTCG